MEPEDRIRVAYTTLPPPLASIPAKYHAPISLLLHSLSTGWIAAELARLAELEEEAELSFLLGFMHDIHQKLVADGLATLKTAKQYVRAKLEELGLDEYSKYVEQALEIDACGKERPIRGKPKELATICHIGDMAQGRFEAISLLYWLREKLKTIHPDLVARFYSVMLPQPFARSYAMIRIYQEYIEQKEHLALASPWGLFVITYEDELPEVIEASWDDLRIDPIIDYQEILAAERKGKSVKIGNISISGDEAKQRLWSRFARMFYTTNSIVDDTPLYPVLPEEVKGLFINIEFTDIEFKSIPLGDTFTCGLCGLRHHEETTLVVNMYTKISGINVKTEKWNRFMPAHIKVKAWDSKGQWKNRIGMCPLCTLDAIGIRKTGFTRNRIDGFIILTIAKPVPVEVAKMAGRALRQRHSLGGYDTLWKASLQGIVLDYNTASIATADDVPEPTTENMFSKRGRPGELYALGELVLHGFYPLKYLPAFDSTIPDRLLVTVHTFPALDFPVTSKHYASLVPWVASLLRSAGALERNKGLPSLSVRPEFSPLYLLSHDKSLYDYVSDTLRKIGWD